MKKTANEEKTKMTMGMTPNHVSRKMMMMTLIIVNKMILLEILYVKDNYDISVDVLYLSRLCIYLYLDLIISDSHLKKHILKYTEISQLLFSQYYLLFVIM